MTHELTQHCSNLWHGRLIGIQNTKGQSVQTINTSSMYEVEHLTGSVAARVLSFRNDLLKEK